MSEGYSGFEVELHMETGTPGTYAAVANIRDLDGPGIEVEEVDSSSRSSGWMTFRPGMKNGGEVSLDVVYDPALHTTLRATIGTTKNWKIVMPDTGAEEWAFSGFVKQFSPSAPLNDALTADITIKVSGEVTFTA
jgi:predicted secreted protein